MHDKKDKKKIDMKEDEVSEMRKKKMREEEDPEMDMEDEGGEADVEMDEEDLADVKKALDMLQDKLSPLLDQAGGEEEMEMEDEEELDLEDPADEPAAGPLGMDPEELRDMLKDVVLDALKDLVDSGDLDISMDKPDEVDVESDDEEDEDEDMDMAMTGEGPTMEEEMVNEVARRVMRRLVNSRR